MTQPTNVTTATRAVKRSAFWLGAAVVALYVIASYLGIGSWGVGSSSSSSTTAQSAPSSLSMCVEMYQKTGKLDAGCETVDRQLGKMFEQGTREEQEKIRRKYGQ